MAAILPAFSLQDLDGGTHAFPRGTRSILCFVKEDCPTCNLVMPLIDVLHRESGRDVVIAGQTSEGNEVLARRHGPSAPLLDDSALQVSFAYDVETVPLVIAADSQGIETDRLAGFDKSGTLSSNVMRRPRPWIGTPIPTGGRDAVR